MRSANAAWPAAGTSLGKLGVAASPALEPLGAEAHASPGGRRGRAATGVIASVVSERLPVGAPRATTNPAASIAARTAVDAE